MRQNEQLIVCCRCNKPTREKYNFGDSEEPSYCYSCYEDLIDEAEERRIQRIIKQQEY